MMLWLFIVVIAALALGVLAWPLLAPSQQEAGLDETDYLAAQLADIERERAIGSLGAADAEAARIEAKRRLLAAGRVRKGDAPPGNMGALPPRAALMGVAAVPLAAIALYLSIGAPEGATSARVAARDPNAQGAPAVDPIASLEKRLAANPDDIEGWATLGESYRAMGRYADAAKAFEKAATLDPKTAFFEAALAEALILANSGAVTEAADAAIDRALALEPKEPRARYYAAQREYQNGDKYEALKMLASLINETPDDAPWLALAQDELVSMAAALGRTLDDAGLSPEAQTRLGRTMAGAKTESRDTAPGRGPTPEQIEAMQSMSPEDQRAMIDGMVTGLAARLEAEPNDVDGWMMLGRSYGVLGDLGKSVNAFAHAAAIEPDDLAVQLSYAEALVAESEDASAPIDEKTEDVLENVLKLDADQPFALYYLGLAAQQRNDNEEARRRWRRLAELLPAGSEDAKRVEDLLRSLK